MNSAEITGLFPTPVWRRQLGADESEPLNKSLRCLVSRLHGNADDATGARWQSQQTLHRLPECEALCTHVLGFARDICSEMTIIGGDSIAISACWANRCEKGGAIRSHYHPNNFLSGSYYVQTDERNGKIEFNDPRPQAGVIVPPAIDRQRVVRDRDAIKVNAGMLLIHPAWLMHAVPGNPSEQPRISISFNLMFPDFGTRMTSPLWKASAGSAKKPGNG